MDSAQSRFPAEDLPSTLTESDADPGEDPFSTESLLFSSSAVAGGLIGLMAVFIPLISVMGSRPAVLPRLSRLPSAPAPLHHNQAQPPSSGIGTLSLPRKVLR
ncbi:hypothetical protein [Synechococcus sp. MW101C3]|uniref:hypothetical protein n=1 Tax=Synechococcus sp. MW101C3 TaxID=210768 RepID=UPI000B999E3D|nr:hypothetical protein [Synechococcus sp. MW101C3]